MKNPTKVVLLSLVLASLALAGGCVYVPARGPGWVPGHWGGAYHDVWIQGHYR